MSAVLHFVSCARLEHTVTVMSIPTFVALLVSASHLLSFFAHGTTPRFWASEQFLSTFNVRRKVSWGLS